MCRQRRVTSEGRAVFGADERGSGVDAARFIERKQPLNVVVNELELAIVPRENGVEAPAAVVGPAAAVEPDQFRFGQAYSSTVAS